MPHRNPPEDSAALSKQVLSVAQAFGLNTFHGYIHVLQYGLIHVHHSALVRDNALIWAFVAWAKAEAARRGHIIATAVRTTPIIVGVWTPKFSLVFWKGYSPQDSSSELRATLACLEYVAITPSICTEKD